MRLGYGPRGQGFILFSNVKDELLKTNKCLYYLRFAVFHLLNLITILQWYTEINRKQMRYLAQTLQIWHA